MQILYMGECGLSIILLKQFCYRIVCWEANVKLPYSKITEYGISIDNLPDDITLKHPSSYGKAAMRKILAIKHQLRMTGN